MSRVHVYLITNTITGSRYVGVTKMAMRYRWSAHKHRAKVGDKAPFLCAIRRYGPDAFRVRVLKSFKTRREATKFEKVAIIKYKTHISSGRGYNLTAGGDGGATFTGRRHTPETIAKMKAARARLPRHLIETFKGKRHSAASLKRMSTSQTGHPTSAATREKIAATLRSYYA